MRCLEIQQPQMLESLKDDLSAPFADHTFDDAGGRISQKCKKRKTWSQNCVKDLIAPRRGGRDVPARWENRLQHSEMRPRRTPHEKITPQRPRTRLKIPVLNRLKGCD